MHKEENPSYYVYNQAVYVFDTLRETAWKKGIKLFMDYHKIGNLRIEGDRRIFRDLLTLLIKHALRSFEEPEFIEISFGESANKQLLIELNISKSDVANDDSKSLTGHDQPQHSGMSDLLRKVRGSVELCRLEDLLLDISGKLKMTIVSNHHINLEIVLPIVKLSNMDNSLPRGVLGSIEEVKVSADEPKGQTTAQNRMTLIVEDLQEMADFLKASISTISQVHQVSNGNEALDWLKEHAEIDLIVSDVMMPEMDGFELVEKIKADDRLSQIPIVMLSSRSEISTKLKIFNLGADDYIIKPFYDSELLVRCEKLFQRNHERKLANVAEQSMEIKSLESISASERFINQVKEILLREIANSAYNLSQLSEDLEISKTTLFRKVRQATGMSANQFFRETKLQQARIYLIQGKYKSVAQVSYAVGIDTPSYFSKLFYERFGIRPSSSLYDSLK
ncbi:MAG: response regulator [Reichenbachiella sp.]|uniref:response regulator n=1 Tax=Reichenbachiella sp. TaxID=2184521 RepID=UPI003263CA7C